MAASNGFGFMIQHASNLFNIAGSFAGLLLLMFIVLLVKKVPSTGWSAPCSAGAPSSRVGARSLRKFTEPPVVRPLDFTGAAYGVLFHPPHS